ncbi:MCP four helix bundle domain-containing protein [Hymenobacter sp. HD11105]
MNLLSGVHRKIKPALLLLGVMLVVLGSSVWETRQLHQVTHSVATLYQDRLRPATDLFALNDHMYAKRQLLTSCLADPTVAPYSATRTQLMGHNRAMQGLLARYQATYMVAEENQVFHALTARLARYNALESQLLREPAPPRPDQAQELARQFTWIHEDLSHLTQIQLQVGQQLSRRSVVTDDLTTLWSHVKIALLVVLALALQWALLVDRHPLLSRNRQNFHLN